MTKKIKDFSSVNSSYAVFFTIFAVAISYILSTSFGQYRSYSFIIILLYPLVVSLTFYLINQLYSSGQIVLLWVIAAVFLPALMGLFLQPGVGIAVWLVWLFSTILAIIPEFIYESLGDTRPARPLVKRLLKIDSAVDRTSGRLAARHLSLTNFKGFIIGFVLLASYFAVSLLLLHK